MGWGEWGVSMQMTGQVVRKTQVTPPQIQWGGGGLISRFPTRPPPPPPLKIRKEDVCVWHLAWISIEGSLLDKHSSLAKKERDLTPACLTLQHSLPRLVSVILAVSFQRAKRNQCFAFRNRWKFPHDIVFFPVTFEWPCLSDASWPDI